MEYKKWDEMLAPYNNAVEELKVKFKNIRKEFLSTSGSSPIEFVTGRTKTVSSIETKAKHLGVTDIENEIEDIAGIRIMCQFVGDIDTIVELIKNRSDMKVIYEKDYVENFKDSGYRSYHVIIKYPINTMSGSKEILCEIQIRTLAMNFWATIEHSLKYKYEHYIPEDIATRLRKASDVAFLLDQEMSDIRDEIIQYQKMHRLKLVTLQDISNKVEELYKLGLTNQTEIYKTNLEVMSVETDITKMLQFKKEIDELLQIHKNS